MASWLLYFMNHNNSFIFFFNGTTAVSIYNFAKKGHVIAPYYYNHTKKDILIAKEKKRDGQHKIKILHLNVINTVM